METRGSGKWLAPWRVHEGKAAGTLAVLDARGSVVASPHGHSKAEALERAELIAAAPDLLAAAKEALVAFGARPGTQQHALDALASAIAKAEGHTHG